MGSSRPGYGQSNQKKASSKYQSGYTNLIGDGGDNKAGAIYDMYRKSGQDETSDQVRRLGTGDVINSIPSVSDADARSARRAGLSGVAQQGSGGAMNAAAAQAAAENQIYQDSIRDMARIQGISAAKNKAKGAKIGAVASGAANAIKFFSSDETLKKDVLNIEGFTKNFLVTLSPYSFRYKQEGEDTNKVIGVMAQELEKTNIGNALIMDHEGHKAVDVPKAVSLLLAVVVDLNKRIKQLEDK